MKWNFLPSKKLGHADGLSRLIPNISVPLEDTVIAALKAEKEAKDMLCNTVKELLVTLDEKMKMQMRLKERNENTKSIQVFSICDDVLLYADRVVMPLVIQKKILKEFHLGQSGISWMKKLI